MHKRIAGVAAVAVLISAATAFAGELRYDWQPKRSYRYRAQSTDDVTMSGMGMNMQARFTSDTTFALHIDRVRGGVASGRVVIESFAVRDERGGLIAGLEGLPKDGLSSEVEIDSKGAFKFKEIVYVVVNEEGENMLVSAQVGPNSSTASATNGDEKVTVYASFDPRTGQVTGGAKVEKINRKQATKKVAVRQDAKRVDILPARFLEMLALPEGAVSAGLHQKLNMMGVNLDVHVKELSAKRALIETTTVGEVGANMAAPAMAAAADDNGADAFGAQPDAMGMGMAGMGMPGMGMPGMAMGAPGAGGGAPGHVGMKVDANFTLDFDVARGALSAIRGTFNTSTNVSGMMKVENATKLQLTAL